jgi:hypothetical protein
MIDDLPAKSPADEQGFLIRGGNTCAGFFHLARRYQGSGAQNSGKVESNVSRHSSAAALQPEDLQILWSGMIFKGDTPPFYVIPGQEIT